MNRIAIYDTTLRDGAQGEGVSFSPAGKVRLARRLDEFGVDYIEGGFAASNPKDMQFFKDISRYRLRHARVVAFGSTRRANVKVEEDKGVKALLEAGAPAVAVVGKTWLLHVHEVLRVDKNENLAMISDSVRYLKEKGLEVIYDAEHFFDAYRDNAEYSLAALRGAAEAGADALILCDTNGGFLPHDVAEITADVVKALPGVTVGMHAHNDSEVGVANSLAAVRAGAAQVQGTINGLGERCGNANLCSIVANLRLKMGCDCLLPDSLKQLRDVSDFVYELTNLRPDGKAPFVGNSAFAHKGGLHVDGVRKNSASFEHIDPAEVGAQRRVLISEVSGASNIFMKAVEMGLRVDRRSPEIKNILSELERLESEGYEFEAAEASFRMMIQKVIQAHSPFFELEAFRVIVEKRTQDSRCISEATIKLTVNGEREHTVGEGDGPVDALNNALRQALTTFYPSIAEVVLTDYRVRILDPEEATGAKTRVLVESSDGKRNWSTVGVSENLIEASWEALVDSVEYKLFLEEEGKKRNQGAG